MTVSTVMLCAVLGPYKTQPRLKPMILLQSCLQ